MGLLGAAVLGGVAVLQVALALWYYPQSLRAKATLESKQALGKVNTLAYLRGLLCPRWRGQVDGVFFMEVCTHIGVVGILCALLSKNIFLWVLLAGFILLARGGFLFKLIHKAALHVPARFLYFASVVSVFMAVEGLSKLPCRFIQVAVLLQSFDLCMNTSLLWPMAPFTQRIEKPSKAYDHPAVRYIQRNPGVVHGLPYPVSTGQLHGIKTEGYQGSASLIRKEDIRPRYLFSQRNLTFPWIPTPIPHLFEDGSYGRH